MSVASVYDGDKFQTKVTQKGTGIQEDDIEITVKQACLF